MPVDPSKYDSVTAKLKRDWGRTVARKGSDYGKVFRIPTGSPEIDWATYGWPIGGVPIGRFTRGYGDYSTGKSMLVWNVIKNAQNIHHIYRERYETLAMIALASGDKTLADTLEEELATFLARFPDGMECAYYDVEGVYHKDYVANAGVDVDRLNVVDGTEIEFICDTIESTLGSCHVHAIDSTTAASPIRLLESDATDEVRGADAARWKDGFRKVEHKFDKEENTLIYVSQVSVIQRGPRSGADQPVGGKKLNFSSSMSLEFKKGAWLYRDKNGVLVDKDQSADTISGLKEPDGIEMTVRVAKSRVSPPFRTARARVDFSNMRFDVGYELLQAALFFGLMEKTSNGFYYALDESGERSGSSLHGYAKAREYIMGDAAFRMRCMDALASSEHSMIDAVDDGDEIDGV